MSALSTLKAVSSLGDLAKLLGFKPKALSYILYKQPENQKYTIFAIPKRKGGYRTIKAPVHGLKLVQRRLSDLLQDCLDEIHQNQGRVDRTAHGFMRGRSIVTNARRHRHRRYVFNLDLEDFFPSINFGRVRGFFEKDKNFSLHRSTATVIAQIACHENALPQGSPCSPVISNLIAHILDVRLVHLAASARCVYSRYADDLTFSTNHRQFPPDIAVSSSTAGEQSGLWVASDRLKAIIARAGFRINTAKTHLMQRTHRQQVTGLIVNDKIGIRVEYRRNLRAMVHRLVTTGKFEVSRVARKPEGMVVEARPGSLNELHGMLGFVDSIDVENEKNTRVDVSTGFSSRELLYRKFLMYSHFYAAQSPVVVCEGETDNVYLTHAIRGLAKEYPALAEMMPDGKIRIRIRLYKYPHSSTARLLGLKDGGSGVLGTFIGSYKREIREFKAPDGLRHPVIILYDNDAGCKAIRGAIKSVTKKEISGAEPFVHVTANLYAVPTPLQVGDSESKIEDFFTPVIKQTPIGQKTVNDSNNFDVAKHYGKKVFAHKVVAPNAGKIDFTGFRLLLANLAAVIDSHHAAASSTV